MIEGYYRHLTNSRTWFQVMGWAYARGDHITKEHLFVYWLAPMEATLLAAWTFSYLVSPSKVEKEKKTN